MPKKPANFPDRDIPPAIKAFIHDSKTRNEIIEYLYTLKLPEFGGFVYELLSIYNRTIKAEVDLNIKKLLMTNTSDTKQLNMARGEIETSRMVSGQIRALLREQENWMHWLLKKIDDTLKQLGEKPVDAFYHPKPEKIIEDVLCPHCREVNRNFKYGKFCAYCDELISSPWVEHTVCPECHKIATRSEIFQDKEGHNLNTQTDNINCGFCGNRFNWKKYKEEPKVFGVKTCINPSCEKPYIPDKRNWKTQRVCPTCKDNNVDSYKLDKEMYK